MKRLLGVVLALAVATAAHAGAGIRILHKGTVSSTDITAAAGARDFVVIGDGTGASKPKGIRAANPTVPIATYVKVGGVRSGDAEWSAAQPYLWRQADGQPFTQGQFGWAYADLQRSAHEWAAAVVIPHVKAALAQVPVGTYDWIFVDNVIAQHASLFVPARPADYIDQTYHDATLAVLTDLRAAFPSLKLMCNGWQGWQRIGLRGEALGAPEPCAGIWFEGVRYDTSGRQRTDDRFIQDQGAFLSLNAAGKTVVWDEPGPSSLGVRQALGLFVATSSLAANPNAALFNYSGPPWADWWR